MSFILSKVIWPLATPSNLLALALVLGGLLILTSSWRRAGRRLLAAAVVAVLAAMLLPVDDWLAWPLEHRFAAPEPMPARVDGIVVLGGGVTESKVPALGGAQLNGAADRLSALIILARRYPTARVVYTGGNATLAGGPREADVTAALLAEMGFATPGMQFERESRNTHENAVLTHALAQPQAGETWLLVTSALHMPRAMGVFRAQGWDPVPMPVDFRGDGRLRFLRPADSLGGRLAGIDQVTREWVGLLAYRGLGYSDTLFPAPKR
jgi:uncharacterized SAM-binding protein YcdF (DUF218 family)